jgi:phage terminase small subunit
MAAAKRNLDSRQKRGGGRGGHTRTVVLKNGEILELTAKEYRYAMEWAKTQDVEKARKAGGYTVKYIKGRHGELMRRIAPLVLQISEETEKLAVMTKADVIQELSPLARLNAQDTINPDGTPIPLHELPREVAAAVSDYEVTRKDGKTIWKYKFHDKIKAVALIGKHLGMFDSKLILQGSIDHHHSMKNIDLSKVPSDDLKKMLEWHQEQASKQGILLEHSTGAPVNER